MALFHRIQTVLQVSSGSNSDQTGRAFAVIPAVPDLTFRAFVDLEQTGGAGSPSTRLHLETSYDGHWIDVIDPIELTSSASVHKFVEVSSLGPLIRARTVLSGSTKPTHTVTVKLAATGAFQLHEKTTAHNTVAPEPVTLSYGTLRTGEPTEPNTSEDKRL